MASTGGLTELEDLRIFLQERVQEADSTIDTSLGGTFDNEVIQPLLARLGPDPYNTPIREFLLSRIRAEYPDMSLADGEPIDDLVVKIMQVLIEPFRRQIQQVSNNQSLKDPTTLMDEEADNLGANFFVERKEGGFSVGVARLYYSAPQFAILTPSNPVYTGSGLRFFPVESQAITADNMVFNVDKNNHYFDIVVRAEAQGEEYDIDSNLLVGIEGATQVVRVENKRKFEEGGTREGTTEFVDRIAQSLTEKSLVTFRGIQARLTDIFDSVRLIQVIGYGDPEMTRDIITGSSESQMYASFIGTTSAEFIDLDSAFTDGVAGHSDFIDSGVLVGDVFTVVDSASQSMTDVTVEAIISATRVRVTPTPPVAVSKLMIIRRAAGSISLSDIPGGILQPNTLAGTVDLVPNEVHIGGVLDVFVRAGDPQTRDITIEGVLDGAPLHFGVDLESFGSNDDTFTHVTPTMLGTSSIVGTDRYGASLASDVYHVLVSQEGGTVEWVPAASDVNRYIQFVDGTGSNFGSFLITEVIGYEYFEDSLGDRRWVVRIAIDTSLDVETGVPVTPTLTNDLGENIRLLEKLSTKDQVRDRDGSRIAHAGSPNILSGVDFVALGAQVGDSVVVETGDDAGIYSIRRLLSSLNTNDTVVLDRDLTQTVTPSGSGNGSGLRYRVADDLNIDLVSPKVTKIPLGSIFTGDDLSTVAGLNTVTVGGSTNFLLAGTEVGDILEILSGDNQGAYSITAVTGTTVTLDSPMATTLFSILFSVYRSFSGVDLPMVRVKEVELLDSNSQPTGVQVPYGDAVDARVLGVLGNRAEGLVLEGFNGAPQVSPTNRFIDTSVDFVAAGVRPSQRLNILTGKSVGSYTIVTVTTNYVDVSTLTPLAGQVETSIRWSVGTPSSGFARLYFVEPTSFELDTGIGGASIQTSDGTTGKKFRLSDVDGYSIIPAAGSSDSNPRDLRVVRSIPVGSPPYRTVVELTDDTRADAYGLEIQVGDHFEVNQPIPFRNTEGFTFVELGIFGSPAGLQTVAGSNQVTVPDSSFIDFLAMDSLTPLAGQSVFIESGPDTGEYLVEEVVATKTLRLSQVMTSTTASVRGQDHLRKRTLTGPTNVGVTAGNDLASAGATFVADGVVVGDILVIHTVGNANRGVFSISNVLSTLLSVYGNGFSVDSNLDYTIYRVRDAYLEDGADMFLRDATDGSELGTFTQEYITIFESSRGIGVDGAYEITSAPGGGVVELAGVVAAVDNKRTLTSTGADGDTSVGASLIESLSATFQTDGVLQGDYLVVTSGAGAGRYRIIAATTEVRLSLEADAPDDVGMDFYIEASGSTDPKAIGLFTWLRTIDSTNVFQPFHLYESIPKKLEVLEVAVKRPDVTALLRGNIVSTTKITDSVGGLPTIAAGDTVEILSGPSAGSYFVASATASDVTIQGVDPFPVQLSDVPYRVWSGIHGSRRMLTLGTLDGSDGLLEAAPNIPYRVLRPNILRVSSTEMAENFDGGLYFAEVQIESDGAGDELNLERGDRLVIASGLRADGYTYSVGNNRLTFSVFEEVSLNFSRRFLPVGNSDSPENKTEISGRNLKIVYESSTIVRLVNDLLRSETDRPVNANPIARHFLPSFVLAELIYRGGVNESEVGAAISDFINSLGALSELEVSDLEAFLTRRGATYVQHPLLVATVTHDLDRNLVVDRSENSLGGSNVVPYNGTGRISSFFATLGEGLQVTRES